MRSMRWFKAQFFCLSMQQRLSKGLHPGPVGSQKTLGQSGIKSLASSSIFQRISLRRVCF